MSSSPPRAALVTGAARRIGRTIAANLAAHGWAVGVHYNTAEPEARDLIAAIEQGAGRAVAVQADLRREDEVGELVARAAVALGGTVSAEHGLGKRKSHLLAVQFTEEQIEAMKEVKRRLDPLWLLGPGTLFPSGPRASVAKR